MSLLMHPVTRLTLNRLQSHFDGRHTNMHAIKKRSVIDVFIVVVRIVTKRGDISNILFMTV